MPDIQFPSFDIDFNQISTLPRRAWGRDPKLLIQVRFLDIHTPSNIQLLMFYTKNHKAYAEGETPIDQGHITTTAQGSNPVPGDIVIGNNDLLLESIVKHIKGKPWEKLRLTATYKTIGGIKFLAFNARLTMPGAAALIEEPIGDTNPSPPARPGEELP